MKSIHILCSDKLTEAACQKLIQQLLADKIDIFNATLSDGKTSSALIGDAAYKPTDVTTPSISEGSVTLETIDLKVTAVLDELRLFRSYEEDEDGKKASRSRRGTKPKAGQPEKEPGALTQAVPETGTESQLPQEQPQTAVDTEPNAPAADPAPQTTQATEGSDA